MSLLRAWGDFMKQKEVVGVLVFASREGETPVDDDDDDDDDDDEAGACAGGGAVSLDCPVSAFQPSLSAMRFVSLDFTLSCQVQLKTCVGWHLL